MARKGVPIVRTFPLLVLMLAALAVPPVQAQDLGAESEDERASAVLKKANLLYDANKKKEAVELWENVVNRFPRSKVRFSARLALGKHFLAERDTDKAVSYLFRTIEDTVPNENEAEVAEAMFLIGKAHFQSGRYGEAFTALRKVTSTFPGTPWCNEAYYYIGMGHFRLKNYKRAIEAFQMVGTSIAADDKAATRLEGGRRLYIKVADDDLLTSLGHEEVPVKVVSRSGDTETVTLLAVGLRGQTYVGSIPTELANANAGDGRLQTWGRDTIEIHYVDRQVAEARSDVGRIHQIQVCGDARLDFVDGALRKPVTGAVLDNVANIRLVDADRDVSDKADQVEITLRVKEKIEGIERPKTIEEIEKQQELGLSGAQRFKVLDEKKIVLTEYLREGATEAPAGTPVHSGRFFARIAVQRKPEQGEAAPEPADPDVPTLTVEEGHVLEIEYADELRVSSEKGLNILATASVLPGNLRPLSVFDRQIKDERLKIRTELKTAEAILQIGTIYKDLGLSQKADDKFNQALEHCKQIIKERVNDRELLEQTQVMLWKIYFAKGDLQAASRMCLTLLNQFPDSVYADQALLQMGRVAEAREDYRHAISVYMRLLQVQNPLHHAEAQYQVARCYEKMAQPRTAGQEVDRATYERALVEYKKVVDKFPNSSFAADAIMKIAEFYYTMKDYARASEIYSKALEQYPDGQFTDRLLLNWGKSLLLMKRFSQAAAKFEQLLADHPQSKYVELARRYIAYAQDHQGESAE
jgi:tetratricopeptide (TPR) repeat protein